MGGAKMSGDIVSTYVDRVTEVENTGLNNQLFIDLLFQGINTILLIVIVIIMIRLGLLGIKALKIYIKKNS